MKYFSLFFEARGIQSYIFESGKLKEMVGASELVKELCESKLDSVINHLNLEEIRPESKSDASMLSGMKKNQVFFSRRSGGVFTALFADKSIRDRFLGVWSILVTTLVPGLETVHAVSESEDLQKLIKETYDILGYNRNCPSPVLPEATPMHVLSPRTGKPAVENRLDASGERVWTDEASKVKIVAADYQGPDALSNSFLPAECNNYSFPKNLDYDSEGEFPFKKDSRYLGLIHADGNGLGQSLIKIRESFKDGAEYAVLLRLFSDRLEKSTKEAAQQATSCLIKKYEKEKESDVLPIRPLVLGGDDLTVLVRADYAMQYTEDYCKAFEEVTARNFADLNKISDGKIPAKLTACAGVAYIKNNQPFMDAFELAESLCAESKKVSKALNRETIPATVTSHVVSNSFIENYEAYKEKELTVRKGGKTFVATLGAYAIDETENDIPTLAALRKLCNELKKDGVTSSSIREYATMIFGDPNISREKWRRWIEILGNRKLLDGLSKCLETFGISNVKEAPWTKDNRTPIFDALQLLVMED